MTTTSTELPMLVWTKPEVAKILKCGLTKVTALISSGDLPSVKIGGQRLIRDWELRAYVDSLPVAPPAQEAA